MTLIDTTEILAAGFSLLSAYLAVEKKFHNWTTGALGIFFYAIVFWHSKLYADFVLQIILMVQTFQGIFGWVHHKQEKASWWKILGAANICWFFAYVLLTYTQDPNPATDSLASVLSLVATYLLINKRISTWFFWTVADAVYIFIFTNRHLWYSLGLYCIFFCLAIAGYFRWKNLAQKSFNSQSKGLNLQYE